MANLNGTSLANLLNGTTGADTIDGKAGHDTLVGGGAHDTLIGGTGNDRLDGGAGNDSMAGGAGNDLYIVNTSGDKVSEAGGSGIDTVQSSVNFTLGAGLENLILTGTAANGTGNTGNNTITGNTVANTLTGNDGNDTLSGSTGNDTLDGGAGADSMSGGVGNDTYVVNAAGDKILESSGTDTVRSSLATYTLGTGVEKLVLTGSTNMNGTGNSLDNTLTGNGESNSLTGAAGADTLDGAAGNDTLTGGSGADSLVGGAGNDTLVWDAADVKVNGGTNTDTLRVEGTTALDLTAVSNTKIVDVEVITLAGTNALTLAVSDVTAINAAHTLRVNGGAGDAVSAGSGWTQIADVTIGANGYAQYTKDGATMQIDLDVDRSGIVVGAMSLAVLDGTNGFQVSGEGVGEFGSSVSTAGDVNGDGYADLLIGAHGLGGLSATAGASYVVFGAASGFGANLDVSSLDGLNGFRISGTSGDRLGYSVSQAGDVNGDGYADLLVGADGATPNGTYSGAAYVVFGAASGFGSNLDVSLLDGLNGFQLSGGAASAGTGRAVSAAGDVNGDGFGDLLVGATGVAPHGANSGASYVVFGAASGFTPELQLSTLNGSDGFRISGEMLGDFSGWSVSAAGDANGDGYSDLLIGAPRADPNDSYSGTSYVVFGVASGFGSSLELSALDGANGFQIHGEVPGDVSGISVSDAGDVNGDGVADLLIGAHQADPDGNYDSGASYVVFGTATGFASELQLSALDGTNGFQVSGAANYDGFGQSVSGAGDVNGDGFADLLIGARYADPNGSESGASYVVFGAASGFESNFDLSTLDVTNGFRIDGEAASDFSGQSVSAAGDVNGDGYADLLVGASLAGIAGESYVIFGRDFNSAVDFAGTEGADSLSGGGNAEAFVAGQGDDTLTGGGGVDVFRGGQGDDRIVVGDAAFFDVDGGAGTDTLAVGATDMVLDFSAIGNTKVTGIEKIDLTGFGSNTLTLALLDVLNLSDTSNELTIDGDAGDTVTVSDGTWAESTDGGYTVYTLGAAILRIDSDITPSIAVLE